MTRVRFKKLMCLLLAVIMTALMLPPTPVVAVAQEKVLSAETVQAPQEKTSEELLKDVMAGLLTVEEGFGTLDTNTVPEIVGYDTAVARSHIARMYDEEGDNLNQVIFLNADGTRTAYFYDHPVKYVDETGKIKDISLNIAEADVAGQFETAANSSVTTFSKNVTDGIGLRNKDTSISLVPHLPTAATKSLSTEKIVANATAKKISNKTVAYTYDDKTTLEYSLTYTGFKEDIVVKEYTGQTRYDFTLYTNGLKLEERNGSFYLTDSAGAVRAQLGDIIIFTADERNNTLGDMVAKTVVENQEYLLSILVDPEFLADEKTSYPIRIDPTVEFTYENNGANAIEDVTINSNGGSDGTAYSLSVGLRENYGIARTLMKFPIFDSALWAIDLVITDAKVEIRDLLCEDEALNVLCYIFSGNEWTESTANWSNVSPNSIITPQLYSQEISYAEGTQQPKWQTYAFNITNVAVGWRTGKFNIDTGIIFKAPDTVETGSTYIHKTLASYNRSAYQPSLIVTYICADDAVGINTDVLTPVTIPTDGSATTFRFEPASTGFYTFESSNIVSGTPKVWLYNASFEQLAMTYNNVNANFRLTYHLVEGYEYYFRVGCNNTGAGSYSVKLSKTTNSSYVNAKTINWGDSNPVSCKYGNSVAFYKFTPTVSGEYLFFTSDANYDPQLWIYNSNMSLITSADDGAGNYNSRLVITLSSGQTYYIAAGNYAFESGTYKLNLLLSADIASGVYSLKNVGTTQYMDIDGPNAQEWVHQWTYHTGIQEKWRIAKGSDGYYTIRSEYGNKYYVGISSDEVNEDNIKLFSSISDSTKWKLYLSDDGQILFESKVVEGQILCAPNTNTGAELQLVYMGDHSTMNLWEAYMYQYSYTVNHYLDQGFSVRLSSIDSNATNIVSSYQNIVAERFMRIFGIQITPTYTTYTSSADTCKIHCYGSVSSWTIDQGCSHSSCHLTTENLRNDLGDGTPTATVAIWTGHLMKDIIEDRSNSHFTRDSVVITPWLVYNFNDVTTYNSDVEHMYVPELMHELSHQLGAMDHYCYKDYGIDGKCTNPYCDKCQNGYSTPRACLMSEYPDLSTIPDEKIYCDDCITMIQAHLNAHH